MEYRLVRYVYDNVFIIATYQLVLEFGLTVVFGLLLWNKVCTGEDVKNWLQAHHYPFYDWVELENTEFADPVMVGPLQLNSGKLTAAYTGHNIASGLLPAQVLFLILTFPRC
ncbi:hypothetical protein AGDE_13898 [Angomonas deanei]|uniref:Uncharacterized protein n=1 Tax=Angomonas deanei TaxID=59799 RepID=A0A7G2CM17_9TRYP|nr:hypothetical protein AGDE_13898 [Angomonas deanei]CAD2220876.1 hypothetical protein, conserved [Angomonas deanei]|eukprot:EPY21626.1 hypothetical protein AGDE_13898 [Angomonas deanei]